MTIQFDIVTEYTQKVLKQIKKTVEDDLYLGLVIREAYHRMTSIEFDQFRKATGLDKNLSTACKFIGIGNVADELLPYASILPNNWTSLYLLTLLDRVTRKKLLDEGAITPDITGSCIRKLIAENSPPKLPGKSTSGKKFHYTCSVKFDAPIGDVVQRELDVMVSDFIAENNCVTKISSPLDGGK